MDKILSQDEINALFSAMSSEDLSAAPAPEKSNEKRKVGQLRFPPGRSNLSRSNAVHPSPARLFRPQLFSSLSAYLRNMVDVHLISVDQISYSEFLKLLPEPTLFASVGLRPLDSNMAIELNPSW